MINERTICALSTPKGTGGLAVIRVSGEEAITIASKVFRSPFGVDITKVPSHKAVFGRIVGTENNKEVMIDEVLLLVMHGPKTFTGENTVEIDCHGGMYICRRILEELIKNGASPADPGEFSKRAFLNGRMDLNEAEAVMDMISAGCSYSLKSAASQLSGKLSDAIESLRKELIDTIVNMEVNIDYPEYEDTPEITDAMVQENCQRVLDQVEMLLSTAESGRMLREGIAVSIVGSPNVGKSSLLNLLLGVQRAIVTDIPGTTRDIIEETLDLKGIPIRITDTAGIRQSEDVVERIGVERSYASIEQADLVLMVLDLTRDVTIEEKELLTIVKNKQHLLLLNKTDEQKTETKKVISALSSIEDVSDKVLEISVKEQTGIDPLIDKIKEMFFAGNLLESDRPLITNLRQKETLMRAQQALKRVRMAENMPQDLLLIDIREAAEALSEVSGRSMQEDVIKEIFSRFCLGK